MLNHAVYGRCRVMADREAMRVVFRDLVSGGGDIVDIALAARLRGWGKHSVQAAAALRTEFAVPIRELSPSVPGSRERMTPQKLVPSCVLRFPPFCDSYGERPLPEPSNTLKIFFCSPAPRWLSSARVSDSRSSSRHCASTVRSSAHAPRRNGNWISRAA